MRVGEVNARFPRQSQPAAESRALVALTPAAAADLTTVYRQAPYLASYLASYLAPFLAQLIATKAHVPQTRVRRRAEPEEALAAYRAGADLMKWR